MAPITTVAAEKTKQEEYDDIHEDPIEDEEDEGSDLDPSQREYLEHHRRLDQFLSPLSLDEAVLYKLARRFSSVYRDLALHSEEQFLPDSSYAFAHRLGDRTLSSHRCRGK